MLTLREKLACSNVNHAAVVEAVRRHDPQTAQDIHRVHKHRWSRELVDLLDSLDLKQAGSRGSSRFDAEPAHELREPVGAEPDVEPVLRDLDPLDQQRDDARLLGRKSSCHGGSSGRRDTLQLHRQPGKAAPGS